MTALLVLEDGRIFRGAPYGALGQGLGDDFTPACRDAWVALYTVVAGQMKDAAAAA